MEFISLSECVIYSGGLALAYFSNNYSLHCLNNMLTLNPSLVSEPQTQRRVRKFFSSFHGAAADYSTLILFSLFGYDMPFCRKTCAFGSHRKGVRNCAATSAQSRRSSNCPCILRGVTAFVRIVQAASKWKYNERRIRKRLRQKHAWRNCHDNHD